MGTHRGGTAGVGRALALALLCATALGACRRAPVSVTGLRVVTEWDDVQVDQLEFRVTDVEGKRLVAPQRRPSQPRALTSGADVVIYFPDGLGGSEVRCDIRAFAKEGVVGTAQITRLLIAHELVEGRVRLLAGPGAKVDGAACGDGGECESGRCVDGVCCQTECAGVCLSCAVPGKQGTCSPVPEGVKHTGCADQGPNNCKFDGACDGAGACRSYPAGTQCAKGACNGSSVTAAGACDGKGTCAVGPVLTCAPFNCNPAADPPRCFSACSGPEQCVPGRDCMAGSCGKKLNGASCVDGPECTSGICVDGVCCESKCDGPCSSCAQVGSLGTCRPVPSGVKDPRGMCQDQGAMTCGTSGSCDGDGGCARYAAGTVCRPSSCTSPALQLAASRCDGAGTCVPGGELACAPFGCSSADGTCNSTCTRSEDCAPGIVCMLDVSSCGRKGIGQPCTANGECASNFCVDKVCCQEPCTGPCRSCALGPVPGVCRVSLPGTPDPRKVCVDRGKSSCGTDGFCDGSGDCRRYAPGTVCGAGTCTAATNLRRLPSSCTSNGVCAPGMIVNCGAYRCNGATCFDGCGADADCVPPNTCNGGACSQKGMGAMCTKPSDCAPPLSCIGSACSTKPLGHSCTSDSECTSTHCTDGVCCMANSCGDCSSCNVSNFVGFCHHLAAGMPDPSCVASPAATCGRDGACDGAGNCRMHMKGTPCAPASCNGRVLNRPRTCNGTGTCVDGGTTDCAPYICNPTTNDCYTSCTADSQCCCGNNCGRRSNSCFGNN